MSEDVQFAAFDDAEPAAAPISEKSEAVARPYTAGTESPWLVVTPQSEAATEPEPEAADYELDAMRGVVAEYLASYERRELRDRIFLCLGFAASFTAAALLIINMLAKGV